MCVHLLKYCLHTTLIRAVAFALVVSVCAVASAHAQTARPYNSLFGGTGNNQYRHQELTSQVMVAEGYDTNVLAAQPQSNPRGPQIGGGFTSLSAEAHYGIKNRSVEFTSQGGTDLRYFNSVHEIAPLQHWLGAGVSVQLGRSTSAMVNEAFSYTPSYLYGLFAKVQPPTLGDTVPPASNYNVSDRRSYTSNTVLRIDRNVGRRGVWDLTGDYRTTTFTSPTLIYPSFETYSGGTHYSFPVSRDARLRLGYDYRRGNYALGTSPVQHDIGLGVDYDRALSRSRRTRLGFNFGSSVIDGPPPGRQTDPAVTQVRAVGNVLLTHQIGRTWTARAAYRRSSQFVEQVSAPVFTDAVTLTADGFVNRRTDILAGAAYTVGDTFGRSRSSFDTRTANVSVRVALTRTIATNVEYLYYYYDFAPGSGLQPGLPNRVNRNSVRVGLTFWVPIIRD